MNKADLALNNLQRLICYKTIYSYIKSNIKYKKIVWLGFMKYQRE